MDKAQNELIKTYYRSRGIAVNGSNRYDYKPYEYSKYALDNKILDLEGLPIGKKYELFTKNSRVREYVAPYIDAYDKTSKGFMRVLIDYQDSGNEEILENFIKKSKFIQENANDVQAYSNTITFDVDQDTILKEMGVEHDYNTVSYYSQGGYESNWADSSEADYMYNQLNGTNQNLINEIAGKLGYPRLKIANFSEEGALKEFLEKYDMENVIETYLSEYGAAEAEAQSQVADEQLEDFPMKFNYNEAEMYIPTVLLYLYNNDLNNLQTFDEFLESVEDNTQINADSIHDGVWENVDFAELNRMVGNELESINDDLDDPESEHYGTVVAIEELEEVIKKYGFKPSGNPNIIVSRQQDDKLINILDYGYAKDDDVLQVKIELEYTDMVKVAGQPPVAQRREGWIPMEKLGDYIDQREIPGLRENKMKNIIINELNTFTNGK